MSVHSQSMLPTHRMEDLESVYHKIDTVPACVHIANELELGDSDGGICRAEFLVLISIFDYLCEVVATLPRCTDVAHNAMPTGDRVMGEGAGKREILLPWPRGMFEGGRIVFGERYIHHVTSGMMHSDIDGMRETSTQGMVSGVPGTAHHETSRPT
jgi:hypothetical protein